ncbi:ComF family protein [Apilactobacillus apisilvae]|uniref:ComF family protein n=1 Tax=Apilactobacillus apisilvae TaxID=2923364 RepID=A0ABY4PHI6_9LACO|nr:phosphoribosyltransferase family protein [Apilactobacillus apisilvae]UQS85072.1 ComF family protein [Apilactobacillus apisilvae]
MKKCLFCDSPLNKELTLGFLLSFKKLSNDLLCKSCFNKFELINSNHRCIICGRSGDFEDEKCSDCLRWLALDNSLINKSFFNYNDSMKEYMQRYKFNGDYRLRKIFQNYFKKELNSDKIVVPIPVSKSTLKRRGFNQVEGFLDGIEYSDILSVKYDEKVTHSTQSRIDRIKTKQFFVIKNNMKNLIIDKDLIIVDDVYTTGTTMRLAYSLLISNGAKSVQGLTLAR